MEIQLNNIYNMDCLEGMKYIKDKSIDCIICDLPYGTTQNKWDSIIPLNDLWLQYERIIKDNGAILLFSQIPFTITLAASNQSLLRYEIIWEKTSATGFLNANRMPLKSHENILVFYKKLPIYNPQKRNGYKPYATARGDKNTTYGNFDNTYISKSNGERYPTDIIKFKKDKEKLHPTQKPVALIEYLIKTYTNEGAVILDNCMGSGTTAIACINTNRQYIGFELEKEYYDLSLKRIREVDCNE